MIDANNNSSQPGWYALDVAAEPQACEAVEYALMEAGALGTESTSSVNNVSTVTAYFAAEPPRELIRNELLDALRIYSMPSSAVTNMTVREVPNQDWLAEWKKGWQPVQIGKRFIVAPPWSEISNVEDRIVIRIEPGMAFGTGTHETTRLCLEAIEKYFAGQSFMDVGTGTGILAIAAAKLRPHALIYACDTDAEAISIARENAHLNDVSTQINFRVGSVRETDASVDCICANLTAEIIVPLLPMLMSATCGRLICSGILTSQTGSVVNALWELGVSEPSEITYAGEWSCIVI